MSGTMGNSISAALCCRRLWIADSAAWLREGAAGAQRERGRRAEWSATEHQLQLRNHAAAKPCLADMETSLAATHPALSLQPPPAAARACIAKGSATAILSHSHTHMAWRPVKGRGLAVKTITRRVVSALDLDPFSRNRAAASTSALFSPGSSAPCALPYRASNADAAGGADGGMGARGTQLAL